MVDRVVVEHLGGDDLVDDLEEKLDPVKQHIFYLFSEDGAHLFICDVICVLDGDDDCVDSDWDDCASDDLVFDCDLGL